MRFSSNLFVLLLLTVACGAASAQANEATGVQQIRLQTFVMASYVKPDFGGGVKNGGGTVGADVIFGTPVQHVNVALELRAVGSGGRVTNQYAYSGGARIGYDAGRFTPYVDLLMGYGKIIFDSPSPSYYVSDNSKVYTYGGGVDVALDRHWAIRADLQKQSWRINAVVPAFYPVVISAGVRYQFHFRNRYGPE